MGYMLYSIAFFVFAVGTCTYPCHLGLTSHITSTVHTNAPSTLPHPRPLDPPPPTPHPWASVPAPPDLVPR
jgi:hypothetical protein